MNCVHGQWRREYLYSIYAVIASFKNRDGYRANVPSLVDGKHNMQRLNVINFAISYQYYQYNYYFIFVENGFCNKIGVLKKR